jgi:ribonuclease BN (tRNA processing enzyme)
MTAELRVLGSGSILPRIGHGCSGYALRPAPGEAVVLLDCGPGSIRALAGAGVGLEEVRRVVFSHYHLDHCLDLFALFFARRNPGFSSPPPLEIFGPPGLAHLVKHAPDLFGSHAQDPDCRVTELSPGGDGRTSFTAGGLHLEGVLTHHTEHSLAWRVGLADGVSLVYTGDCGEEDAVAQLAGGADLLLAECSCPDGAGLEHHLTPRGAARLAQRAGVKKLVLTHFYPAVDPEAARSAASHIFTGPIEIAHDGSLHRPGAEGIMGA